MSRRALVVLLALLVSLYLCIIGLVVRGAGAGTGGRLVDIRGPAWCRGLRWATRGGGDGGAPVALASFPGSGNTWLRYLLQQATGIATGSVYLDYSLRSHGFPAENVSDASVLVVKTHELPPSPSLAVTAPRRYRAAVLLLREPAHAILADFNRQHNGHVGTAPRSAFTSKHLKITWAVHVARAVRGWRHFHAAWLREFPRAHVVHYELLVRDPRPTLRRLLAFLNRTVSEDVMDCVMANKEGIYRRRRRLRGFDPYTPAQAAATALARRAVHALLERREPTS